MLMDINLMISVKIIKLNLPSNFLAIWYGIQSFITQQ